MHSKKTMYLSFMDEDMEFRCDLSAFGAKNVAEQIVMNSEDVSAFNTPDAPQTVAPKTATMLLRRMVLSRPYWRSIRGM